MLDLVNRKAEGQEITAAGAPRPRPQVVDLMEALKASLAKKGAVEKKPLAKARRPETAPVKRASEPVPIKRAPDAPAAKRAQAGRK